jgi:hemin uptake protein HemP
MNQHEVYGTDSVNNLPADTHPQIETESPPSVDSADLLKGGREVLIRHHGEIYRLRLTRNDKLILNK